MRVVPWQAADCRRMSPEWFGPVLLLLLAAVDSAVQKICRLTVRRNADWVGAVACMMRRAVGSHIRAVAADRPKAVMLVVVMENWRGPPGGRAM